MCATSCGGIAPPPLGLVKHFPLTIALTEPLGDSGSPLPEDIKAILMPMEAKNCSGIMFIPDITIVRLDIQDAKPEVLDLGQDQNAIQKAAGQAPKPDKARSVREDALKKQNITALMAQPSGPKEVAVANIKKLLASNQHIFTTQGTQQLIGDSSNGSNITVANSPNELLTKISSSFCSKPGAKPETAACVIVYKAGDVTLAPVTAAASTPPPTTGTPAPASPASVSPEPQQGNGDALFAQLSAEVEAALQGRADRKEVDDKLRDASEKLFPQDYRFPYERARLLASIGKGEHPAFHLLFQAAQVAITNKDSKQMLQKLDHDGEGIFHNLHHHDEWQTMLSALQNDQPELVRK